MNLKNLYSGSKIIGFLLSFVLYSLNSFAQKPLNPVKDSGPKTKIELIKADSLVGENSLTSVQTFLGNVIFRHNGVLLGCNKAVHNLSSNFIEAYGKVVINQGDTLTIVGDTLLYDGNQRFARVFGKSVILRDKKVTLRTTKIFYDLNSSQSYYPVPGFLQQDSSRLSSKQGYYNTRTKVFNYIGDVEIINPSYVICTDSLDYNANTKLAIFKTFTTLRSKNGDLSTYKGQYNLKTKESLFKGRAKVNNVDFSLEGDTLNYDNLNDKGSAFGNVIFISFKDSLITTGNRAYRSGDKGITKMFGDTYTEKQSSKDTLLLRADSLWIYEVPKAEKKPSTKEGPNKEDLIKIIAKKNVKIFKSDFQSISDSLFYDYKGDKIGFYQKPILWNVDNQLEADTIRISLKDQRLDKMSMVNDCFVIQKDTIGNYNQIKGRKLLAIFGENAIMETIDVQGNGESNFFALDERNKIIGLNKVQCGSMVFHFDQKKIRNIVFKSKPESLLIPPNEVSKEDLYLEKFEWKDKIRPRRFDFINSQQGKRVAEARKMVL
jgi:lipopolysaccharide export system protein LptA